MIIKRASLQIYTWCHTCPHKIEVKTSNMISNYCGYDMKNLKLLDVSLSIPEWCPLEDLG